MSSDANNQFLSAGGAVLKDPADVERALGQLWAETRDDSDPSPSRICVANLVVVAHADQWSTKSEVLGDLIGSYPARMIVLLVEQGSDCQTDPASLNASVSAICHADQSTRFRSCCEQILLRGPLSICRELDQTVLPLLEADLPVAVWWTADVSCCADVFERLRRRVDRMIVDSGIAGLGRLEQVPGCAVREIGWYRTYQLRELLAQMFDRCPSSRLEKLESVELDYRWQSDEDQIDAVWLIAFLAGQLGWSPVDRSDNEQWQFQRSDHKVRVSLRRQEAHRGGLDRIKLTSEQNTYEASRRGQASDEFQIRLCDHATCQMPRSVQVTRRSSAGHLAAALNGRQHDAAFARAAPIADWMFSS